MIKKYVRVALGAVLLTAGCATDQRIVSANQIVEKQGVWVSGEYAYFRASDGGVFVLIVPSPRDQRRLDALAPLTIDASDTCLALHVRGSINGKADRTNRPFFVVAKIVAAKKIDCGNQV